MADESHVIRGINWRETFPFTQIFRAFRVAIHPTKLILALIALLALYAGGRVLDVVWPVQYRAIPGPTAGVVQRVPPALRGLVRGGGAGTGAELSAQRMGEVVMYEAFSSSGRAGGGSFADRVADRRREIEDEYVRTIKDD